MRPTNVSVFILGWTHEYVLNQLSMRGRLDHNPESAG
jgi:hypothetical protein